MDTNNYRIRWRQRYQVVQNKIIAMVYAYEDSTWEIQSMSITKFYKKKQQATIDFSEIKMYGTIFNYTGFALQALIGKHQMRVYLNVYT